MFFLFTLLPKLLCSLCIKTTGFPTPPPPLISRIGHRTFHFYPHPSKDDGFLNREVRIFSSKKPTKFGPFNGRFQGSESKVLKV